MIINDVVIDDAVIERVGAICADLPEYSSKERYEELSKSDEYIWNFQFTNAENLSGPDVTIPEGYLHIMPYVFAGRNDIVNVTLPDGVVKIFSGAFENCRNLKKINIPDSVRTISNNVFNGCESLAHIKLPEKIEKICKNAFSECVNLKEISLPGSIQEIDYRVFEYCTGLKEIKISAGVKRIRDDAFRNCTALKNIFVDAGNSVYSDIDGVLFNKDGTVLIRYPKGRKPAVTKYGHHYSIPDCVTEMRHDAFSGCKYVESIGLPASLADISYDRYTLYRSSYMGNYDGISNFHVDTGNEIYTDIDGVLFNKDKSVLIKYPKCKKESSYRVPDGVVEIKYNAFGDCRNLRSVTLPKTLIKIGEAAFRCSGLKSITIPENVTDIECMCFTGCENLAEINMKAQNVIIGESYYYYTAWYNAQPDGVLYIGNVAVGYKGRLQDKTIIEFAAGTRRIATEAFGRNFVGRENLIGVIIPDSVVEIESRAFAWCDNLKHITIKGNNVKIAENAFARNVYICEDNGIEKKD